MKSIKKIIGNSKDEAIAATSRTGIVAPEIPQSAESRRDISIASYLIVFIEP